MERPSSIYLVALLVACLFASHSIAIERRTHTVVIESMRFTPAALRVREGDAIRFVNEDIVPHTVTGKTFDSRLIQSGKEWTLVAEGSVTLSYHCRVHPTMKGEIEVTLSAS